MSGDVGIGLATYLRQPQPYRVAITHPRRVSCNLFGWVRQQLPEELGECYSERFSLEHDLILIRHRYHPILDLVEEASAPYDGEMLGITFCMQGNLVYQAVGGPTLYFRAGYTAITVFQTTLEERSYAAGATVNQLRLLVGEKTLCRYIGIEHTQRLLATGKTRQLAQRRTSSASSAHVTALVRYLTHSDHNTLSIHIHALSLLAEQLDFLAPNTLKDDPTKLSVPDLQRLQCVRDLMIERLDQPLTVRYLCSLVGLSETGLKEGFHRVFKTTPHRMLLELRMRRAHSLLEAGYQVAQVAYKVGYKHPSNFSSAFSSFYGISPKSVFTPSSRIKH
ncbi:MAG: AraC family transcriptional regulator [Pseudomonas gingeri]